MSSRASCRRAPPPLTVRRSDDSPSTVLLAFYLRYPNPFASHVLSCDVIARTFNPATGGMRTTRLLLKRGIIPKWARSWLGGLGGMEAWVMEESEVWFDGEHPRLVSSTRNISHKKIMTVIEGTDLVYAGNNRCVAGGVTREKRDLHLYMLSRMLRCVPFRARALCLFCPPCTARPMLSARSGTLHKTTAHIVSDFGGALGSLVRGQIESWGAGRFEGNAETASRLPFRARTHA